MSAALEGIESEVAFLRQRIDDDTARIATLNQMHEFYVAQGLGEAADLKPVEVKKVHRATGLPQGKGNRPRAANRLKRRERILELLATGEMTTAELCKATEVSAHTTNTDVQALKDQCKIEFVRNVRRSQLWRLAGTGSTEQAVEREPDPPPLREVPPLVEGEVVFAYCANCDERSIHTGSKKCAWCDGPLQVGEAAA